MKKLTNVSPFLLLLVPVFMVMLFAFSVNSNNVNNDEAVVKTATNSNSATIVKAATVILK